MTDNGSEATLNNSVLYNYTQLAYEYAQEFAEERLRGTADQVLSKLYGRRLASVLDEVVHEEVPASEGLSVLREWLRHKKAPELGTVLTGKINDVFVEARTASFFEHESGEFEQAFQQDVEEGLFDELGAEAYASYLPIHFFFSGDPIDTSWGIYVSEQGITRLASVLRREYRSRYGGPQRTRHTCSWRWRIRSCFVTSSNITR